ncbi:MAG: hypothetical protein Q8P02_02215 [Candidatus Micrarchaeota archaeon]|nr:hypothetical protein [Candidatus Micrarchaeota archaeon]
MPKAYLDRIFGTTLEAYRMNGKLILFASVPFLLVVPLLFLLPNYASLGALFLRYGSVPGNLDFAGMAFILAVYLASLLLSSFAIASINVVIRSQRTLNRLTHYEVQHIETAALRLFVVYLTATAVILAANLLLLDAQILWNGQSVALQPVLGSLLSFLVAGAVLFAPQSIAVEDTPVAKAVAKSTAFMLRKPALFVSFLVAASLLFVANDALFLVVLPQGARLATLLVSGFLIIPFLEVFKSQLFLSKYNLI